MRYSIQAYRKKPSAPQLRAHDQIGNGRLLGRLVPVSMLLALLLPGLATAAQPAETKVVEQQDRIPFTLMLGIAPVAKASADFPKSFSGMGTSAAASVVPWRNMRMAIELGTLSQTSNMSWLGYKYYLSGASQYSLPREDREVKISGTFVEIGAAQYGLTRTDPIANVDTAYKGFGVTAQYGYERPIFKHVFLSARVGFLSSAGGAANFNGLYTVAFVGLPLAF